MTNQRVSDPNNEDAILRAKVRKRMGQVITTTLVLVGILFLTSGRLDWVWLWVYVGSSVVILVFNAVVLLPSHPEMVAERSDIKTDVKPWDQTIGRLLLVPTLAQLVVIGLDARFRWSPPLSLYVHLFGLCLMVGGNLLFTWSMVSNPYFSRAVRLQFERGHTVATSGPYQVVRHPGYVGMILSMTGTCVLLGSLWSLIPTAICIILYVIRTAFEDHTLRAELNGYQEYAQHVGYRLFPGIW